MKQRYWPKWNTRKNKFTSGFFAKHNFGKTITIKRGGRNWKAVIKEAQLDRDMNFVSWKAEIINRELWYRKFPSDKCNHWVSVKDPNNH